MGTLAAIGGLLVGYLTGISRAPYTNVPTDPEALARAVRPGDVVLVDGRRRISTAIKYLTQSTWSHAALCVADHCADAPDSDPQLVEADAKVGVRQVTIAEFAGLHTRICRPVGLTGDDVRQLTAFALSYLGDEYDLTNIIDLARYLIPAPPVPARWRRRMLALGSGEPTRAICSTLIARAFQSIQYPILPQITRETSEDPGCIDCVRDILHIRHHSLFTPRDLDVSPYFEVVKPSLQMFDHRALVRNEAEELSFRQDKRASERRSLPSSSSSTG